jgi:hypothetical protein
MRPRVGAVCDSGPGSFFEPRTTARDGTHAREWVPSSGGRWDPKGGPKGKAQ